jgi:hypothetical protein
MWATVVLRSGGGKSLVNRYYEVRKAVVKRQDLAWDDLRLLVRWL